MINAPPGTGGAGKQRPHDRAAAVRTCYQCLRLWKYSRILRNTTSTAKITTALISAIMKYRIAHLTNRREGLIFGLWGIWSPHRPRRLPIEEFQDSRDDEPGHHALENAEDEVRHFPARRRRFPPAALLFTPACHVFTSFLRISILYACTYVYWQVKQICTHIIVKFVCVHILDFVLYYLRGDSHGV